MIFQKMNNAFIQRIAHRIAARKSTLQYFKDLFPKWPEYVVHDWVYKPNKDNPDSSWINTMVELYSDLEWTEKVVQIPDLQSILKQIEDYDNKSSDGPKSEIEFSIETLSKLENKLGGAINPEKKKDAERYDTQKKILEKSKSSEILIHEPIILIEERWGEYSLLEGWHRMIEGLRSNPEGFKANAWVGRHTTPIENEGE
jgi:hypothetical protein